MQNMELAEAAGSSEDIPKQDLSFQKTFWPGIFSKEDESLKNVAE